jgi:hypothetical protein
MIILDTDVLSELRRPTLSHLGLRNNRPRNSLLLQSPRWKSFVNLSCSPKASAARGCWQRRRLCLPRIWRAASWGSIVTQRELFPRLRLTAVPSADLSAMLMRRSQPSPKCEGPGSRPAMLSTSRAVALMPLTPGMVRKPVASATGEKDGGPRFLGVVKGWASPLLRGNARSLGCARDDSG